jgi:hypothetical protein
MGRYCKAYQIERFREFSGWAANVQNVRKEMKEINGAHVETPRELTDQDHFYLHENFIVTDGIFLDENVIFDNVSPEWVNFCKNELKFEAPVYEPVTVN